MCGDSTKYFRSHVDDCPFCFASHPSSIASGDGKPRLTRKSEEDVDELSPTGPEVGDVRTPAFPDADEAAAEADGQEEEDDEEDEEEEEGAAGSAGDAGVSEAVLLALLLLLELELPKMELIIAAASDDAVRGRVADASSGEPRKACAVGGGGDSGSTSSSSVLNVLTALAELVLRARVPDA